VGHHLLNPSAASAHEIALKELEHVSPRVAAIWFRTNVRVQQSDRHARKSSAQAAPHLKLTKASADTFALGIYAVPDHLPDGLGDDERDPVGIGNPNGALLKTNG